MSRMYVGLDGHVYVRSSLGYLLWRSGDRLPQWIIDEMIRKVKP